jgi:hypothetical protein
MVMIAAAGMITAIRERRRPDAVPTPPQSG